jgi:hypothetical protein
MELREGWSFTGEIAEDTGRQRDGSEAEKLQRDSGGYWQQSRGLK